MSKITASTDLDRVPKDKFNKYLVEFLEQAQRVVNGQIEYGSNIRGAQQVVAFTAADTPVTVDHGLGRFPTGYQVFSVSAALVVYEVAKTDTTYTLSSSAIGSATIFFF